MIGSMFNLDHRINELRPSDRDHEVARQLREAASPTKAVARVAGSITSPWRSPIRFGGQPARVVAG